MVILAVDDAAKIVRAGVRRVRVAADMGKQRIAVLVPRNVRIGLEAAVQTAFEVDRLLLVVRGRDFLAHRANLVLVVLAGENRVAQHSAVVLQGLHGDEFRVRPVLKGASCEVAGRPARHDDNDLVAGFGSGQHRVREPLPLLVECALVKSLLGLLDQVIENQFACAEAGRRAARRGCEVACVLPLERPLARSGLAVLDACLRENVRKHDAARVEPFLRNAIADRPCERRGQRFVVAAGHDLLGRITPKQPLAQQHRRAALAVARRHIDHQYLAVALAERLQAPAQRLEVRPVLAVEVRRHQLAERPEVTPGKLKASRPANARVNHRPPASAAPRWSGRQAGFPPRECRSARSAACRATCPVGGSSARRSARSCPAECA